MTSIMVHRLQLVWSLLLGCSLLSCSQNAVVPAAPPVVDPCVLDLGVAAPHLRVALTEPVDPRHAPAPTNASERLVFAQLYQTLVATDCQGEVVPELAESWSSAEGGRVWEFRLRAHQSFADGTAMSPHAVMQSWAERTVPIVGMNAIGEHVLRVELRMPVSDVRWFADPALAVARHVADQTWPLGSGALRVDSMAAPGTIRIAAKDRIIDFVRVNALDARAALDARMDAVVTRAATALAYAQAGEAYATTPLPWSRTYVLLSAPTTAADSTVAASLFALTRDAVRADVRAASAPSWLRDAACHDRARTGATPAAPRAVIAYQSGDAVAQGIAERIAAVSWPVSRAPAWLRLLLPEDYDALGAPTAVGLDETTLQSWLRWQRALAYVVAVPHSVPADCRAPAWPADIQITPILDVREHLIHRRNLGRISVLGDGTIRFQAGQP